MILQVTLILVLRITYIHGTPPPGYKAKSQEIDANPPKYEYGYNIADEKGTGQGKMETRDGIYALGRYYVQGSSSSQSVEYLADDWGFHPLIQYSNIGPNSKAITQIALGKEAVNALKNGSKDIFDPNLPLSENFKRLQDQSTKNQNKIKEAIKNGPPMVQTTPNPINQPVQYVQPVGVLLVPQYVQQEVTSVPLQNQDNSTAGNVYDATKDLVNPTEQQPVEKTNQFILQSQENYNLPQNVPPPLYLQIIPQNGIASVEAPQQNLQMNPEKRLEQNVILEQAPINYHKDGQEIFKQNDQLRNVFQEDHIPTQNVDNLFQLQPQALVQGEESLMSQQADGQQIFKQNDQLGNTFQEEQIPIQNVDNLFQLKPQALVQAQESLMSRQADGQEIFKQNDQLGNTFQEEQIPTQNVDNLFQLKPQALVQRQESLMSRQADGQEIFKQNDQNTFQKEQIPVQSVDNLFELQPQALVQRQESLMLQQVNYDENAYVFESKKIGQDQQKILENNGGISMDLENNKHQLQFSTNRNNDFSQSTKNDDQLLQQEVDQQVQLGKLNQLAEQNFEHANIDQQVQVRRLNHLAEQSQDVKNTNDLQEQRLVLHPSSQMGNIFEKENVGNQGNSLLVTLNQIQQPQLILLDQQDRQQFLNVQPSDSQRFSAQNLEQIHTVPKMNSLEQTKFVQLNPEHVHISSTESTILEQNYRQNFANGIKINEQVNLDGDVKPTALPIVYQGIQTGSDKIQLEQTNERNVLLTQKNAYYNPMQVEEKYSQNSGSKAFTEELSQFNREALFESGAEKLLSRENKVYDGTENNGYGSKISTKLLTKEQSVTYKPKHSKLIESTRNLVNGLDVLSINDALEESNENHGSNELISENIQNAIQSTVKYQNFESTTLQPSTIFEEVNLSLLNNPIVVADYDEREKNYSIEKAKEEVYSTTQNTIETIKSDKNLDTTEATAVIVTPRPVASKFLAPITAGIRLHDIEQNLEKDKFHVEVQKSVPYYVGKYEYLQNSNNVQKDINSINVQNAITNLNLGKVLLDFPLGDNLPKAESLISEKSKLLVDQQEEQGQVQHVQLPIHDTNDNKITEKVPPVEKIVEKPIPVEVTKYIDRPYAVHVPVAHPVPYPVDRIIEKYINRPYPVEVPIHIPVEIPVPIDRQIPIPYPVEKIVVKPVTQIVEKKVPQPYPVEKIVEKEVKVPVEVTKYVDRPYRVEVPVEKLYPVEKIVEKIINKPYPVEVCSTVQVPVSHPVPVEKIIEKEVPVHIPLPIAQAYVIPVEIPAHYPVQIKNSIPQTYQINYHPPINNDGNKYNQGYLNNNNRQRHRQQRPQHQYVNPNGYTSSYQTIPTYVSGEEEDQGNQLIAALPPQPNPYIQYGVQKNEYSTIQQKPAQNVRGKKNIKSINNNEYIGLVPPNENQSRRNRQARESFDHNPKMEYGFLPPMVPSLEIDESGNPIEKAS